MMLLADFDVALLRGIVAHYLASPGPVSMFGTSDGLLPGDANGDERIAAGRRLAAAGMVREWNANSYMLLPSTRGVHRALFGGEG